MHVIVACALALVAAQDEGAPTTRASGYLSLRSTASGGYPAGEAASPSLARLYGVPALSVLAEANVQVRVAPAEALSLFADLSLFSEARTRSSGPLGELPGAGNEVVPSELYALVSPWAHLTLLAGRKRTVWGSGIAWNPTDLLDPPKDPTDPSYQRAGAWMVRAEAPFERFTVTALWAPLVTEWQAGLPRRLLEAPEGGPARQLAAARLYALVADTDVTLMWLWSDRYADAVPDSHRPGLSLSRVFLRDLELHAEALAQRGRDVPLVRPECAPAADGSLAPLAACVARGVAPVARPDVGSGAWYLRSIAGGRWTFGDDSILSAEWLYEGTGLSPAEFGRWSRLLAGLAAAAPAAPAGALAGMDPAALLFPEAPGEPRRFAFRPLRRHYLFAGWQKPRVLEDFTVAATLVVGLEDGSGLAAPGVTWSAREWLALSLLGLVPFGGGASEFGMLPYRFRALVEARAYY